LYPPPFYPLAPPLSPGGRPLAEFGVRLLAWLIDSAILTGATLVVAVPAVIAVFTTQLRPDLENANLNGTVFPGRFFAAILLLEGGIALFAILLRYVYEVEMMYRSGQTVGKRVMKLQVIPIDPAQRLTRGSATVRFLVSGVVGAVVPMFSLLDGLWQLWDKPFLQTLHDKAAQTVVIKLFP